MVVIRCSGNKFILPLIIERRFAILIFLTNWGVPLRFRVRILTRNWHHCAETTARMMIIVI